MRHNSFLAISLLPVLAGCAGEEKHHASNFKPDARLLAYTQRLVIPVDSLQWLEPEALNRIYAADLNPVTDTVRYKDGKIYVSCLMPATGCGQYDGDIHFGGDTISLEMHLVGNVVCTEQDAWRVTFLIENKSGERYKIRKY